MNIIAKQLVLVGTKSGLVVMCKILTVVVAFYLRYAYALILLYLAVTCYSSSLFIYIYIYIYIYRDI